MTPVLSIILSLLARRQRKLLELIAVSSSVVTCIAGLGIVNTVVTSHTYNMLPYFSIGAMGALILGITVITGAVAICHSVGYLREEEKKHMIGFTRIKQYYLLLQLFLICMFVSVITTNPIVMWIAIEATTLSTVFLISFFNRKEDIEAAWKYLIINSVGLLLALLGTILFLSQVDSSVGFVSWSNFVNLKTYSNPQIIKFAFLFILIGYGTKMGLVPMHTWRPDAYNKAPLPIVALLSGALLNVAFFAILQYKVVTDVSVGGWFSQDLFLLFGTLSIVVTAIIMYTQTNFKRLLAYSSSEHAGIMLLGFGFGGIGVYAGILHMVYHALAKPLLFLLSSSIAVKYSSSEIKKVTGLLQVLPKTSILFVLGFLAITGVPPFGMFFTEWYIILAGSHRYPIIVVVFVLSLLLVFAGMFRPLFGMIFGTPPADIKQGEFGVWTVLPVTILVFVLFVISLYIPDQLQTLLREASSVFINTKNQ